MTRLVVENGTPKKTCVTTGFGLYAQDTSTTVDSTVNTNGRAYVIVASSLKYSLWTLIISRFQLWLWNVNDNLRNPQLLTGWNNSRTNPIVIFCLWSYNMPTIEPRCIVIKDDLTTKLLGHIFTKVSKHKLGACLRQSSTPSVPKWLSYPLEFFIPKCLSNKHFKT